MEKLLEGMVRKGKNMDAHERSKKIVKTDLMNVAQERYFYKLVDINEFEEKFLKDIISRSHPTLKGLQNDYSLAFTIHTILRKAFEENPLEEIQKQLKDIVNKIKLLTIVFLTRVMRNSLILISVLFINISVYSQSKFPCDSLHKYSAERANCDIKNGVFNYYIQDSYPLTEKQIAKLKKRFNITFIIVSTTKEEDYFDNAEFHQYNKVMDNYLYDVRGERFKIRLQRTLLKYISKNPIE
jgi:hypothetical protein